MNKPVILKSVFGVAALVFAGASGYEIASGSGILAGISGIASLSWGSLACFAFNESSSNDDNDTDGSAPNTPTSEKEETGQDNGTTEMMVITASCASSSAIAAAASTPG